MYQEIQIRSLDDLFPLLKERDYERTIGRFRSNFVYHGTCNAAFRLSTSLQRNCKGRQAELEPSILRNFSKYAASDDPDIDRSVWRQLIIGQHHGRVADKRPRDSHAPHLAPGKLRRILLRRNHFQFADHDPLRRAENRQHPAGNQLCRRCGGG